MEIFITKIVGEVSESVSVCGVNSVKEVLDLYKGMSDIGEDEPAVVQHPEVVLEDGSVAVGGMTLGEVCGENGNSSKLLVGGEVQLTEVELSACGHSLKTFKRNYKSDLGDGTYYLKGTTYQNKKFDLTIGDIKLLHKEFGEIIEFWEE